MAVERGLTSEPEDTGPQDRGPCEQHVVRPERSDEVDDLVRVGIPAVQVRVVEPDVLDEGRIHFGERGASWRTPALRGAHQVCRTGEQQVGEIEGPAVASKPGQDAELADQGPGHDIHHREALGP